MRRSRDAILTRMATAHGGSALPVRPQRFLSILPHGVISVQERIILLAVEQYGLGACWVHIRNHMGQQGTSDQEIRSLLGVPDGYSVLNLVAIGEKGEEKRPYTDADLHTENVHYEKY